MVTIPGREELEWLDVTIRRWTSTKKSTLLRLWGMLRTREKDKNGEVWNQERDRSRYGQASELRTARTPGDADTGNASLLRKALEEGECDDEGSWWSGFLCCTFQPEVFLTHLCCAFRAPISHPMGVDGERVCVRCNSVLWQGELVGASVTSGMYCAGVMCTCRFAPSLPLATPLSSLPPPSPPQLGQPRDQGEKTKL